MHRALGVIVLIFLSLFIVTRMKKPLHYIPIGDSYTIGEGVEEQERWPNLLAANLSRTGTPTEVITNPSRTGWTSRLALDHEVPLVERERPGFVTILIGVNDIVQGVSIEQFEKNLVEIIDRTLAAISEPRSIVLITIPDFTLTPVGKSLGDTALYQKKLTEFNSVIEKIAQEKNLPLADIYGMSTRLGENPIYVTNDGLHPSARAYMEWEKEIFEKVPR